MVEGTSVLNMTAVAHPRIQPKPRARAERGLAPAHPRTADYSRTAVPERIALPKEKTVSLPKEQTRKKVKTTSKVIERPYMKLSFRMVALYTAAVALLMVIVYSNMQLSQIQKNNAQLRAELAALQRQESGLRNQIENNMQLSEVERYAKSELGMVKPDADQIIYIDLAGEDHAEVIEQKTFWETISEMFSSALVQAGEFFD